MVFGFYNAADDDVSNRGRLDTLQLEFATMLGDRNELWELIDRGYVSDGHACVALDCVTYYYSLMDMRYLATNIRAKEMVARIPAKPVKAAPKRKAAPAPEPEEEYLKLWGWELPVSKDLVPDVLQADVPMSDIAGGIGKVLKSDVTDSAKRILTTEIRLPFLRKKDRDAE